MASLTDLLQKARSSPGESDVGGPTLALALHCLMVKNGYQPSPSSGRNPYSPPTDWNAKYKDEWKFDYTRKGYKHSFTLHCSLQAATGKMFIQGREMTTGNIQILGLQIENYSLKPSGKLSWKGMLKQEDVLEAMFQEHIADKLQENASEGGHDESTAYNWVQRATDALQQRDAFVLIGIASSAVIIAGVAFYFHRRRFNSKSTFD